MTAQPKFMFDADFGPNRRKDDPRITLVAHEAAIGEAEARGYANGLVAAEAQARTEAERRSAAALEQISRTLQQLAADLSSLERRVSVDAVEVALAVAHKLAPALIAKEPIAEVTQLAMGCFSELRNAPHIAVRVNGNVHSQVQELLSRLASAQGFEGRLIVLGDDAIAPGDCRLEWADGGMVRDTAATMALIEEAVGRYVTARRDSVANGNLED
jgi:flagellar assembly protein FliH